MQTLTVATGAYPVLSVMVIVPLIGALLLAIPALRGQARGLGLTIAIAELGLGIWAAILFDPHAGTVYQLAETRH